MAKLDKQLLDMNPTDRTKEMLKRMLVGTYFTLTDWEEKFIEGSYKNAMKGFTISKLVMEKVEEIYVQKG